MPIEDAVEALRFEPQFMRNVAAWRRLPASEARYAPYPEGLDQRLIAALRSGGIAQLYTHQAEAVATALRGEHLAVVTQAASGKTLCYNLPVLHRLLADPRARALYLFPTKALAHDQLAALHSLIALVDRPAFDTRAAPLTCAAYDGDTPAAQRPRVRETARIVLSNPDMLHAGILPQHTRWSGFFAHLCVVVVDEMHVYRGVFGSHVANLLRRLRRVCAFYGNQPQFIFASATIANPGELAARLAEAPVRVIGPDRNGAPRGEKHLILYNPPVIDPTLGIRRSSHVEAGELAARLLAREVQTIVFAGSRLSTELILMDLRAQAERDGNAGRAQRQAVLTSARWRSNPAPAVRGYRGGYLPDERRAIERGLREGSVCAVVATSALELGIDIGELSAVILAGYPGTIASAWQQMGRAGRRQGTSLAILVATAAAMDQYIMAHPDYLLGNSPERALINPDNPIILASHLACAAAELPFQVRDGFGGAPDVEAILAFLAESGELYQSNGRFYWGGEGNPAARLSLRSGSPDRVVIQATDSTDVPRVVGEIDRFSVPLMAYEGAIYIHGGDTYRVEHLDWEAGVAHVRPVDVDYYTRPSIGEEVQVQGEREARVLAADQSSPGAGARTAWGEVRVVARATGYRTLRRSTHEVLGFGTIDLPEQVLETTACWLAFLPELIEGLKVAGAWLSDPNDYGPSWPVQREAVRARDGYRCQSCGMAELPGKQHDVHHKIPFRAFVADPALRAGLPAAQAWQAANVAENLVTLCAACHHRAEAGVRTRSGLGGVAALLAGVAPLFLMCDPRDLGIVVEPQAAGSRLPTITLYEKIPAGIGYAQQLYELMPNLLVAAYDLVRSCPCERGCPSCVGPVLDHDYALDTKLLSSALLAKLCETTNSLGRFVVPVASALRRVCQLLQPCYNSQL